MNKPTGKLSTKVGEFEYTITQGDHVYIGQAAETMTEVNGVKYSVTAHLYLIGTEWQRQKGEATYREPYISRCFSDPNYKSGVSQSARNKIYEAIREAWQKHADNNRYELDCAEYSHLQEQIDSANTKIDELKDELENVELERYQLIQRAKPLASLIREHANTSPGV